MAELKKIGMAGGTFAVALGIGFVMQNGDAMANRFTADADATAPSPFVADDANSVQAALIQPETAIPDTATNPNRYVSIDEARDNRANVVQTEIDFADDEAIVVSEAEIETAQIALDFSDVDAAAFLGAFEAAAESITADTNVQLANLDPVVVDDVEAEILADPDACVPEMVAVAGPAAMVKVSLTAPCYTNAPFTTQHDGLVFTLTTDDEGYATFMVPALSELAVIIAAFENGDGGVASVEIADLASYDRAILQFEGDQGFSLHAYEGDAGFGEPGHIHAGNPGSLARVVSAEGGHLMVLGDPALETPKIAEVYTFPSGMTPDVESVLLAAEAQVTNGNCLTEFQAQGIQYVPGAAVTSVDLEMVLPECDAVGEFVILQNMFEDLTLASR